MPWLNVKNQEFFEDKKYYLGKLFARKIEYCILKKDYSFVLLLEIDLEKTIDGYSYVKITYLEKDEISDYSFIHTSWQEAFDEII